MASGRIFDPLVALRAAPLVSATCTLLYAWDQEFFLGNFNRPQHRQLSRPLLPSYFGTFFYRGTAIVVSFLAATCGSSLLNLRTRRPALQARGSLPWYVAGAILSASHLLFVPLIAPSCQALVEAGPDDDSNKTLDEWRSINWIRAITVDLGAWVAVAVAVAKTLEANY